MKKRAYEKPKMNEVFLDGMVQLLLGSNTRNTPPEEIPDYDDWMGARKRNSVWDNEDEEEE